MSSSGRRAGVKNEALTSCLFVSSFRDHSRINSIIMVRLRRPSANSSAQNFPYNRYASFCSIRRTRIVPSGNFSPPCGST